MLNPTKMMNDVMLAISMYFAAAVQRRLLLHNEDVWTLIFIFAFLAVWLRVEHAAARYKEALEAKHGDLVLGEQVMFNVVGLFSQTLVFLMVHLVVHVVDESISEQSLWMESVVLPSLLILFCVLATTYTKRAQTAAAKRDAAKR